MYNTNILCIKDFNTNFNYIRIFNNIELYSLCYTINYKTKIKKLNIIFNIKYNITNSIFDYIINELQNLFYIYRINNILKSLNINNIKNAIIEITQNKKDLVFKFKTDENIILYCYNNNIYSIMLCFINPLNNILFNVNRNNMLYEIFYYYIFGDTV